MGMRLIEFNKKVKEVKNDNGETVYFPVMILDGKETYFSSQGSVVFYDNYEDAQDFIDE